MAVENSLRLEFTTADASKSEFITFKYANPSVTASQVQTLGATIVTNNSIYSVPPLSLKSAELITTTSTPIATS